MFYRAVRFFFPPARPPILSYISDRINARPCYNKAGIDPGKRGWIMKKKMRFLAVLLALAVLCGINAAAEALSSEELCVGEVRECHFQGTCYVGRVVMTDPSVATGNIAGTSLTISGRITYGTYIGFVGLKPGKTTATLYSEYGGWLGTVSITVKQHARSQQAGALQAVIDSDGAVTYQASVVQSCSRCGETSEETRFLDGKSHEGCEPYHRTARVSRSAYEDMDLIRRRLRALGYPLSADISGTEFDPETWNCAKHLQSALGIETKGKLTPEALGILFSGLAPAYREPNAPCDNYLPLARGDEGESVTALQQRLLALGFLPEDGVSGRYDEMTAFAVTLVQIEIGCETADGAASPLLQRVLFLADPDTQRLLPEDFAERHARLAAMIGDPAPEITVTVTLGSNLRNSPSYEGAALAWVNPGDELSYTGEDGLWYAVKTQDGLQGYLPMDRCTLDP